MMESVGCRTGYVARAAPGPGFLTTGAEAVRTLNQGDGTLTGERIPRRCACGLDGAAASRECECSVACPGNRSVLRRSAWKTS
jgi:hypothetical protein